MLITTCTHCVARFRVTPAQLNLRQGQVRCGHCGKIFSGFEALERFPDDDTGSRILAARAAAVAGAHPPPGAEEARKPAPFEPIPLEQLPEIRDDEPQPVPAPAETAAAAGEAPAAEPPASVPPPPRASGMDLLAEAYEAQPQPRRASRAWIAGCVLLGTLLALQALYALRAQVAQSYPVTRPWLESACAPIGCRVPWLNDAQLLKLDESELLEVPGRPGEIALGARIRNLAATAQEFPHLELTLTDLSGQAAARRVLRPDDYLGRPPAAGEVMAPGSELAIQLRLEAARLRATGYELLLFYP